MVFDGRIAARDPVYATNLLAFVTKGTGGVLVFGLKVASNHPNSGRPNEVMVND